MRPIRSLRPILGATLCCLLAACGGGGGGDAPSGGGGGGSGGTAATRAVPGYTVQAERTTALNPGHACTIQLIVTPDAGQPAVKTLEGWLGTGTYVAPGSTIAATTVAGKVDTWRVVVAVPDPLAADATVWLRLTGADGSVMEVGRNAFEIAGLPGG